MKKIIIYILVFIVLLGGLAYGVLQLSKMRNFQFFGGLTSRVNTQEKVVALTFDDAPTGQTDQVLKILNDADIKATFFAIGQNLEKYPEEGKAIAESGNEIGNHSYSHQRMILKTPGFIKSEIEKTDALIRETGYSGEITFRPPNGKKLLALPWYLKTHDRKTIMWDIEPESYPEVAKSSESIAQYVIKNTKPGSIILLHPLADSAQKTRDALPEIIATLQNEGYKFVTVSELLKY
ncbi:MAG: polysaccharide deacetylase family protein [Candidatus Moranbacteria bacterium]|nr:polysaccharide deacetylase family protein [Candidatus Moranbacteria bacterium]